ncbi:MAG: DUF1294 domain-containing protein [Burkholderiales bacterium]|nr:DUF1294 domain-containing protein [Burkholderiales bacterium]
MCTGRTGTSTETCANTHPAAAAAQGRAGQALSLVGGRPGALVAQQVLRHKLNKASFRAVFWATGLVNVAGFVAIHSPLAAGWRV